jgi:serpin B
MIRLARFSQFGYLGWVLGSAALSLPALCNFRISQPRASIMNTVFLAILSLGIAAAPNQGRTTPTEKDALQAVVKGNTEFALDLHRQVCPQPSNLCYSPWSISTVLAMTSAGAQGRTLEQMSGVLHLPDASLTHPGVAAILRQMKVQHGYELSAANALFVGKDIPWRKDFLDLTHKYYGTTMYAVDFRQQPDVARQSINHWVTTQTKKRIPNLIGPGVIDSQTSGVLVNALYFKGQWEQPFKKSETLPRFFDRTPTDRVQTPIMFQSGSFLYSENQAVQVLGMPYKGNDLLMVFVLPKQRNGLAAIEKNLTGRQFRDWISVPAFPERVDVYLPRFKFTSEFDLKETLKAMGMSDAFSEGANFHGMTEKYPLKISAVIHKTYLDLQEEGTEAAAATAVAMMPLMAAPGGYTPPPPPVFRADHPFLFSIVDRRSGSLLFVGRVNDPTR